jgi:hypothetical protein
MSKVRTDPFTDFTDGRSAGNPAATMSLKWRKGRIRMRTWISDYSELVSEAGNMARKVSKVKTLSEPLSA